MASSDSEDFESADEDFDSPKLLSAASSIANKKETLDSGSASQVNVEVKCRDVCNKSKEAIHEHVENRTELELKDTQINETEKSKDIQVLRTIKNEDDDGWSCDDWGDETDNCQIIEPKGDWNESIGHEKQTNTLKNEDDGWGCDDWGDENDNSKKKDPKPPVTDSDDGNWENFEADWNDIDTSKEKSKIAVASISSYDTFPVLNNLSASKEPKKSFDSTSNESTATVLSNRTTPTSSWSSWKPWDGVASFISTATSHVSQGFATVIESGIGVPNPEEMARIQTQSSESMKKSSANQSLANIDDTIESTSTDSVNEDRFRQGFGQIVSGVTSIGNKVISGGLDTLEGIGKKTMTILQENDPLLINKRKFLGLDGKKPVLSQILREAKEKSDETEKNLKQIQRQAYKKQLHFETLFDHYHGLVHLEALEMLSKQSEIKLQSLLQPLVGRALNELKETLDEVKELCDIGELEHDDSSDGNHTSNDLTKKFVTAVEDLDIKIDFSNVIKCWKENCDWLDNSESIEAQDVFDKALRCLAETSAIAVHVMHKLAELLLITEHHSTANEADSLVQITQTFCWHLNGIANRFGAKLNTFESSEEINSMITNIFLEESNSITYIQSAFQLFIPILQIGAA